jgi:hypothetical protein
MCLDKTTDFFSVLVDIDSVNAMAAYRPVVQACVHGGETKELPFSTVNVRLLNRPIYRHKIDLVHIDEHRKKNISVVLAKHRTAP